jgi:cytochrome c553
MNIAVHRTARVLFAAASLAGMAGAAGQTSAAATQAPTLEVRSLGATCAACHGTDGAAVPDTGMVALAGYPKDALVAQMRAFRDGSRTATVMHQIARGYTDRQIETLAAYFATRGRR